ncbi:MAG: hypothetical protein LBF61_01100 [Azoarcus sp.]|jgi:type IV pilus assembly protein PilY1|nr:hypothetical protein [Azoarcus sp.]
MKPPNYPQHTALPLSSRTRGLLACAIGVVFSSAAAPVSAELDIPNVPLVAGSGSDPNVLYLHDDSGSMYFSFMPDLDKMPSTSGFRQLWTCSDSYPSGGCNPSWNYGSGAIGNLTEKQSQRLRSPQANFLYYNPGITYEPPPAPPGVGISNATPPGTLGNADFNNAWFNGYDLNGRNSSGNYAGTGTAAIPRRVNLSSVFKATYSYGATFPTTSLRPGEYLSFQNNGSAAHYYDCPSGWSGNCTRVTIATVEQKQNFANWYSYYRTRNMAARAGISRAFVQLGGNIRVGWGKINKSTKSTMDGKSISTIEQGVRPFTDTRKKEFLNWLYAVAPSGDTPLRRALDDAGQYYDRPSGSIGPWADDPAKATGTEAAACRKSFAILMTDGYWNSAAATVATGNQDGPTSATSFSPPGKPDGAAASLSKVPFRDGYSNTLADVAWYYWAKDLLPNASNKVDGTKRDPAWWQHMTTYTIGLGVAPSVADKSAAFRAADAQTAPGFAWPNAEAYQIDDLLHAGVNGHGDFFSAADPDEFVSAMQSIIESISDIAAGSGKIATNEKQEGASGKSDALIFNSTYQTENWSGDLSAREINAITKENHDSLGNIVWKASSAMPMANTRKIFTRSDNASVVGSAGIEFRWASLNAQQKLDLQESKDASHGQNVLDYLRGSGAKEVLNGGAFRNRDRASASRAPLGDSPNNSMVYDKATDTIYLGANDGMLHAFDAATGAERFAYIPSVLFPKLPNLTHPDYSHKYYVDGEAAIAESGGERYLAGALGRGGKSLYGLRVTTPGAFSQNDVLWELNGRTDAAQCGAGAGADILDDLGIIIGKPVIARLSGNRIVAIVGNGYNSCHGKAALYLIDVANGKVIQKVDTTATGDNGLSTPFAFDHDEDGILSAGDAIYAGDLKGNMWRFAESGGTWRVSFGGAAQPMFTARNANNEIQPITAQPLAVRHPVTGMPWVFFGTGQFLQGSDKSDQSVQSWYGLIDGNALPAPTRAALRQRKLKTASTVITLANGTKATAGFIEPEVKNDMTGKRGWFIDFNLAADAGERIINPSQIFDVGTKGTVLITTSTIPTDDPCGDVGGGWIYTINPFTGATLGFVLFDADGDDIPARISIGSLGMPQGVVACGESLCISGTSGEIEDLPLKPVANPGIKGRVSWRELHRD